MLAREEDDDNDYDDKEEETRGILSQRGDFGAKVYIYMIVDA